MRFRHGRPLLPSADRGSSPTTRRALILTLLDGAEGGLTRREIHAQLGSQVSERQLRRALEELRDGGLIVSEGRGPSGALEARWGIDVLHHVHHSQPGASWGRYRGANGGAMTEPWTAEADITRLGQRPRWRIQENRRKVGHGRRKELTAFSKSVVRVHDNRTDNPSG